MSYVQNFQHIVIGTKSHRMVLPTDAEHLLYAYITGFFKNKGCSVIKINGIPNHIHILVNMNPMLAIAAEIGNLKRATSIWLKANRHFPLFEGWQKEYASFSVSYSHLEAVKDYIDIQKAHHSNLFFDDEYNRLILKNGLVYYKP